MPPKHLKIHQVPKYILGKYGEKVTVPTIYNWINKGRNGTKLRVVKSLKRMTTTEEWVDEFIAARIA
jgi:hypothetical protein